MKAINALIILAAVLTAASAFGATEIAVPKQLKCDAASTIRAMIDSRLNGDKFTYAIVKFDGAQALTRIKAGKLISYPVIDKKNKISVLRVKPTLFSVRDSELTHATRSESDTYEIPVTLGAPLTYAFDGCKIGNNSPRCGGISFLEQEGVHYESLVVNNTVGTSIMESADSLLRNLSGEVVAIPERCAVVYNAARFDFPPIDTMGDDEEEGTVRRVSGRKVSAKAVKVREYKLHEDAVAWGNDEGVDPLEVFNWMESLTFGVNLIYSLIEPISGQKFDITLKARTLHAWNDGFGPTETDAEVLVAEINDPDYQPGVEQRDNELYYLHVGYDFDEGTAGWAGSICLTEDADGFGDDVDFQMTRAVGQQTVDVDGGYEFATFWGRMIVKAHELGHVLGGRHSRGARNQCAGGRLPNLCGSTLMLSGAAGGVAPDFRSPFFSRANDNGVVACIRHADDL